MSQNLENSAKFQEFQLDNLVDFKKCCKTRIFLQKSVPIQPKTSNIVPKFAKNWQLPYGPAGPSACEATRDARGGSTADSQRAHSCLPKELGSSSRACKFQPLKSVGGQRVEGLVDHQRVRYITVSIQFIRIFAILT